VNVLAPSVAEESETLVPRAELRAQAPLREIRHEYTRTFASILSQLRATLLVSTYHAGKLVVVSAQGEALELSYHNFEQAMGVAVHPHRLAVGTRGAVWFLESVPGLAPRLAPEGRRGACYLARSACVTGEIHGHEMAFAGDELWVVNTRFSCLCTLDGRHSFVPRWRPRFISALAAEDRCHLNGLAMCDGRPAYVTVMAESDSAQGWRATKATSGAVIDVASGEIAVRGLCMPHSPRVHQGRIWLLDSGKGRLVVADAAAGSVETVAELPGYTRGLTLIGPYAFIGLSKIRETSTFGGVPVAERRESLKCGVAVAELASGRQVAFLEFASGVEEIFDVQALAGVRWPLISGPHAHLDGQPPVWMVPASKA
jgi:uncharacterized protein (TIGR03032 family)